MGAVVNRNELEKLFDGMRRAIAFYENTDVSKNAVELYLADGKKIKYFVPAYCVPHLLGVNVNYLSSTGLFSEKSSYPLLKQMLDNEYRVYSSINSGFIDFGTLFSSHVSNKVGNFDDNIKIDVKNSMLVCEYRKERAYVDGDYSFDFDHVLVKRASDGTYLMLGLRDNNQSSVPITSQVFDSLESLNKKLALIIKNQEITFINSAGYVNGKVFHLFDDDKVKKIVSLRGYANKFDAIADVSGDYARKLDHTNLSRSKGGSINFNMASSIINCLGDDRIITPEDLGFGSFDDMDSNLVAVIIQINNVLLSRTGDNSLQNFSYSELLDLRRACDDYRASTTELEGKIEKLSDKINTQDEIINSLVGENQSLKEAHNAVVKILLPNSSISN